MPPKVRDLHAFATALEYHKIKFPYLPIVSVYSKEALPYFQEISEIVMGSSQAVKEHQPFLVDAYVISPHMLGYNDLDMLVEAKRRGLAASMGAVMIAPGASAPGTLFSSLLVQNVDLLGANVLNVALNGVPSGYICHPSFVDMRTGFTTQAGPDYLLMILASIQLRAFYGTNQHVPGLLYSDSKLPDIQAGITKANQTIMAVLAGAEQITGIGILACSMVWSPVQAVIDYEMLKMITRFFKGIDTSEDKLGVSAIKERGIGASYLDHDLTVNNFRQEFHMPKLCNRDSVSGFMKNPHTMLEAARTQVKEILAQPCEPVLSKEQINSIHKVLSKAEKELCE